MQAKPLSDTLSVSAQITLGDIDALAADGVRMIINNRPDNEEPGQLSAEAAAHHAATAGIAYRHIPITGPTLSDAKVTEFAASLAEAGGRVHAHCKSGMRSATLWALDEVRSGRMTREAVMARAGAAGLDVSGGLAWLDRQ